MHKLIYAIIIITLHASLNILHVHAKNTDHNTQPPKPKFPDPTKLNHFNQKIKPFLNKYCTKCHGEKKQKADLALHNIDGQITNGKDLDRWEKVAEFLTLNEMPPPETPQPSKTQRRKIVTWITTELKKMSRGIDDYDLLLPANGNRVNHNDLFSGKHKGPAYSKSRLWRISPHIFNEYNTNLYRIINGGNRNGNNVEQYSQPFVTINGNGISDFSILRADEGTINVLMQTCSDMADRIVFGEKYTHIDKKTKERTIRYRSCRGRFGRRIYSHFQTFINNTNTPTHEETQQLFDAAFTAVMFRPPTQKDRDIYLEKLFKPMLKLGGRKKGAKYLVLGLLMSPEFIFRMELGMGQKLPDGRRHLGPWELAFSISHALREAKPDEKLIKAASEGNLKTKKDVAREVRRLLEIDERGTYWGFLHHRQKFEYQRILRFFREYFGYTKAADIFKEEAIHPQHHAGTLIKDADILVLDTLKNDKHVIETLLGSDKYFVAYLGEERTKKDIANFFKTKGRDKKGNSTDYYKFIVKNNYNPAPHLGRQKYYMSSYNIDRDTWNYPVNQPFKMPEGQRMGMLTHPAWLVAFSLNFENDPVRRGKWIQEKLLAGVVPDIPIGVDAKVPEDHTKTLRERFNIVNAEQCWRCHRKMNPYGNPFEAYDHFGRFRTEEITDNTETHLEYLQNFKKYQQYQQSLKDNRKGRKPKPVKEPHLTKKHVIKSTIIKNCPDPSLNGEYKDAIHMMSKFSKSNLVRQSFLRHMFRNFMGRNETLDDSPTLIAMDKMYLATNGSFKETLITLLTSDSFLYRK